MGLPTAAALRSPVARASTFYFAFFMTAAVSNPYLAIWLTSKGVSPSGIGIINAMPFLAMILLNQAIGRIADVIIGGTGGVDLELILQPPLADLMAEDRFGERRAADISQTDEENSSHATDSVKRKMKARP